MANFALVNQDNLIVTVVVADKEYIDSGALGDPANWIEDTPERKGTAGVGKTWDPIDQAFIGEQPWPSWFLNRDFEWEAPVPRPEDGNVYRWHEEILNWVRCDD
jgi:hypothetical protein